jgi:DNA-directed RNA polymerase subunit K/omega
MEVLSLLDHHSNTKIDSHFRIVIIGVQRAKQLLLGAPTTCQKPFAKETSRAVYEVLEGDVEFVVGTEARLFKEASEHAKAQAAEIQPLEVGATPPTTKTREAPAEKK